MDKKDLVIGPGGPGLNPIWPQPNPEYVSKKRVPYKSPTPGEYPLIGIGNKWMLNENVWDQHLYFSQDFLTNVAELNLNCVEVIARDINNPDNATQQINFKSYLKKSIDNCNETGVRETVRISSLHVPLLESPDKSNLNWQIAYTSYLEKYYSDEKKAAETLIKKWELAIPEVWKEKAANLYEILDEPHLVVFKWIAKIKDAILQTDKWETLSFSNLFPIWAPPESFSGTEDGILATTLSTMTYADYLDEFDRIVKPSVWCFDCYLSNANNMYSSEVAGFSSTEILLKNYKVIRDKAYATSIPFWSHTQCCYNPFSFLKEEAYDKLLNDDFGMGSYSSYRSYMRIETHCSLAFGSQGILFWQIVFAPNQNWLWSPLISPMTTQAKTEIRNILATSDSNEVKRSNIEIVIQRVNDTIVNGIQKKSSYDFSIVKTTPIYEELSQLTGEIKSLESLFLGAINKNVWTINLPKTKSFLPEFGTKKEWFSFNATPSYPMIISHLVNAEQNLDIIVVINLDFSNYCTISAKLEGVGIMEHTGRMSHRDGNDSILEKAKAVSVNSNYTSLIVPGDWRVFTRPLE